MKPFVISCPHCGQSLEADDTFVGQTVQCPVCEKPFEIAAREKPEDPEESGETISTETPETEPPSASHATIIPAATGRKRRKTVLWIVLGVLAVLGTVGAVFLFGSGSDKKRLSKAEQKQLWGFVLAAVEYIETNPTKEGEAILRAALDGSDSDSVNPSTAKAIKDGIPPTVKVLEHGLKAERINHVRNMASKLSPEFSRKDEDGVFPKEFLAVWNALMRQGDPNGEFVEILDDARIDSNGSGTLVKLLGNLGGYRDSCIAAAKQRDDACRKLIGKIRGFCSSALPNKREAAILEEQALSLIEDPGRDAREIDELLNLASGLFPSRANAFIMLNEAAGGDDKYSFLRYSNGEEILETMKDEGLAFPGMARSLRRRLKGLLDEADTSSSIGRTILLDIIRANGLSSRKKTEKRNEGTSFSQAQANPWSAPPSGAGNHSADRLVILPDGRFVSSEEVERMERERPNTPKDYLSSFAEGLVLRFDFDEWETALKDQSGHGNDGEVVGAQWARDRWKNGQFQFDGKPGIVDEPDLEPDEYHDFIHIQGTPAGFPVDDFTISVVCSPDNEGTIIGSGENEMRPRQWFLRPDRFGWACVSGYSSPGIGGKFQELRFPAAKGTIQHLVVSRHGKSVVVFRNGLFLAKSQSFADSPFPVYSYGLFIGNQKLDEQSRWCRWNCMKGTISHVMIWNRILTKEEIESLWNKMKEKYRIPTESRSNSNNNISDSPWH